MRISDAKKGLRVQLTKTARERLTLPDGRMPIPRHAGTIRSPKPYANQPPYDTEAIGVYVVWDGLAAAEWWSLLDLEPHWLNETMESAT
jgi:hypothetical protein